MQAFPTTALSEQAREQLARGLTQVNALTQQTLEGIRILAQQLRPSVLDDLGLAAAFRWLVEESRQRLHLMVDLTIDGVEGMHEKKHFPSAYERALFRIAQESLTNIARHAHARDVSLSLIQHPQTIVICIADDGDGYDMEQTKTGIGIFGMHERAALLGGTLTITSRRGEGTTVEATLPLCSHDREEQRNGT